MSCGSVFSYCYTHKSWAKERMFVSSHAHTHLHELSISACCPQLPFTHLLFLIFSWRANQSRSTNSATKQSFQLAISPCVWPFRRVLFAHWMYHTCKLPPVLVPELHELKGLQWLAHVWTTRSSSLLDRASEKLSKQALNLGDWSNPAGTCNVQCRSTCTYTVWKCGHLQLMYFRSMGNGWHT